MSIELTYALVFRCVVPRYHLVSLSLMSIELTYALVFRRVQFYGSVFGSLQVTCDTDPYSTLWSHLKKKSLVTAVWITC
jgi:hypothetical protein